MINLKIDGRSVTAREGETVLSAARGAGIAIPTLCHHEAVEPYGGCRLCVVEISKPEWKDWSRLVTACLYPCEEGLSVRTNSQSVEGSRRLTLELLLARCPDTPAVREIAAAYGVHETPFAKRENPDDCILCGICVRVCARLGHNSISLARRGPEKIVTTPFSEPSDTCVGCASCAHVCPTGAIKLADGPDFREIWGRRFEMAVCSACGASITTKEHAAHLCKAGGFVPQDFQTCGECSRRKTAGTMSSIVKWQAQIAEETAKNG